jgi:hypothetical protein
MDSEYFRLYQWTTSVLQKWIPPKKIYGKVSSNSASFLGRSPGQNTRLIYVQISTELYFLIAKFLMSGPCQRSAKVSTKFQQKLSFNFWLKSVVLSYRLYWRSLPTTEWVPLSIKQL